MLTPHVKMLHTMNECLNASNNCDVTRFSLWGYDVKPLSGSVTSLPAKTSLGNVGGALKVAAGLAEVAGGGDGAGLGAGGKMAPVCFAR